MSDHKQVTVMWGETPVQVDEGLSELLGLVWRHDIITVNSCQENRPGIAWIEFFTPADASRFLNIVAKYPKKAKKPVVEFYGRVVGDGFGGDWEYDIIVKNDGVEEQLRDDCIHEKYLGSNDFDFYVCIRFPVTDIQVIVRRLKHGLRDAGPVGV